MAPSGSLSLRQPLDRDRESGRAVRAGTTAPAKRPPTRKLARFGRGLAALHHGWVSLRYGTIMPPRTQDVAAHANRSPLCISLRLSLALCRHEPPICRLVYLVGGIC